MDWDDLRRSENVEEERGSGSGLARGAIPLGLGGLVVVFVGSLLLGLNPFQVLSLLSGGGGGTLSVVGHSTAAHVQLQVRDTGSGILAEKLAQIFEPLYTTKPAGTGLGLYIVQQIAAAHGGQVTVESAVGQGTTFTLTLPREATAPSP